jgi:E3 ubiquitin-protein ligase TRIP12
MPVAYSLISTVSISVSKRKSLSNNPTGFAALKPPLTVVKKELPKEASQSALDMQLPSVMTCANYLKLPDYASPTILRDRLLVAVNEADGSFHLS